MCGDSVRRRSGRQVEPDGVAAGERQQAAPGSTTTATICDHEEGDGAGHDDAPPRARAERAQREEQEQGDEGEEIGDVAAVDHALREAVEVIEQRQREDAAARCAR